MPDQDRSTAKGNPSTRRGVPHRRPRKRLDCEPCRSAKLRSDRQQPCAGCRWRDCAAACTFRPTRESAASTSVSEVMGQASTARLIPSTSTKQPPELSTPGEVVAENQSFHSPHGEQTPTIASWDAVLQRPTLGQDQCAPGQGNDSLTHLTFGAERPIIELLGMLPARHICEFLISRYFEYQAPLFHVLHGPTFQGQYTKYTTNPTQSSLSWLALLFIVCSSANQTLEAGDPILNDHQLSKSEAHTSDPLLLSRHLRGSCLECLSQSRFMVRYDLNTLEALLIMIYGICHSEGVDRSWVFLGAAFNMAIALRCNADSPDLDCIERQRRWRCWAGVRILHTYQGILFRDVDLSFLLSFPSPRPADVNDLDIRTGQIMKPSSHPTSMSLMNFKIRLFELSTQICRSISGASILEETSMNHYDGLIASEQQQWTSTFLPSGSPNLFKMADYAYWCILETYAHQLYLLIHRPFYHSQSTHFLPSSRKKYVESSIALLDLHQKICELPTFRPYRWLANGMTSFNALQGAVALAACLIDRPGQVDTTASHRTIFDAAVQRIQLLQASSVICARAYSALQGIQTQLSTLAGGNGVVNTSSGEWNTTAPLLDLDAIDWAYWDSIVGEISQEF